MTHSINRAAAVTPPPATPAPDRDLLAANVILIEDFKGEWTFQPQMRRMTLEQATDVLAGMEITDSLDLGTVIMHSGRHWKWGRTVIILGANNDCAVITRHTAATSPRGV